MRNGMHPSTDLGRPVHITSVSFPHTAPETMLPIIENLAAEHPDLILLPETWFGSDMEPIDGPTAAALRGIARKHNVYVVHPFFLSENGKRLNTAVLIDRNGNFAGRYDKLYPYWAEFDLTPPCTPGQSAVVWDCDFGKVGMAVCFDANFPSLWRQMEEMGAELVLWSSAYAAGDQLKAHALNYHYPIVTATNTGHSMVFDIDGRRVIDTHSPGVAVNRVTLDLDTVIFHENFNWEQRERLLSETPPRVQQVRHDPESQWFMMRSASPDVSAREVCREAGMEELCAYKRRSREAIDRLRENRI